MKRAIATAMCGPASESDARIGLSDTFCCDAVNGLIFIR